MKKFEFFKKRFQTNVKGKTVILGHGIRYIAIKDLKEAFDNAVIKTTEESKKHEDSYFKIDKNGITIPVPPTTIHMKKE